MSLFMHVKVETQKGCTCTANFCRQVSDKLKSAHSGELEHGT